MKQKVAMDAKGSKSISCVFDIYTVDIKLIYIIILLLSNKNCLVMAIVQIQ